MTTFGHEYNIMIHNNLSYKVIPIPWNVPHNNIHSQLWARVLLIISPDSTKQVLHRNLTRRSVSKQTPGLEANFSLDIPNI